MQTSAYLIINALGAAPLTCLTTAKQQVKVRLAEVDTLESKQPYGNRAQQSLAAMVFSKLFA